MGMELKFLYGVASADPYPIMTDFTVACGCNMKKVECSKQRTFTETPFQTLLSIVCTLITTWSKNLRTSPNCTKNHLLMQTTELDVVRFFNEHVNDANLNIESFDTLIQVN